MNKELRERDLLWCKALVATLGTYEIEKVTAEFNRIRPDKAAQQSVQSDEASCNEFIHDALVTETDNKFCSLCGKRLRR